MLDDTLTAAPSAEDETEDEEQDIQFPVLPEDDELPPGGISPEIKVARPDRDADSDGEMPIKTQK
jgi:hypothetical protein